MTPEELESTPAWIARDPRCGHNLMMIVDTPDRMREVANEVASCIRQGLVPERVTVREARAIGLQWCEVCHPPKKKPAKPKKPSDSTQETLLRPIEQMRGKE